MQPDPLLAVGSQRSGRASIALAAAAILLAILVGVALRLVDPLSNPVVPAEDPYTHMALVREHLRTGQLEALNSGDTLYPPGLHGFLAAAWVYTGSDLYGLIRMGPVILGAVGILGVAILMWRTAGPVAGFVAAVAIAVAPEAIFRSTMMSPTALDLAILPFFLYALLRILAGRLGWAGVAAPMAVFIAVAHPWLLAILCAAGIVFLASAILLPWPSSRGEALSKRGCATAIAVLGAGLSIALMMPSFAFVLPLPAGINLVPLGIGIAAIATAPALVMAFTRRRPLVDSWRERKTSPLLVRLALSAAIAVGLLAIWFAAKQAGMPMHVDVPRMFGWPVLALAFAALVAWPFIASPIANLAGALVVSTLPFVVFNPLQSEFLSHRTAIFLGVGLALLTGVAAAALVGVVARFLQSPAALGRARTGSGTTTTFATSATASSATGTTPSSTVPASASGKPRRRSFLFAIVPALLVASLLGGTVYAGTPDAYPGGWYRLYNSCELDGLRDVAREANADPDAIVVVGDWQAKLVLAALTNDAERIWYKGDLYTSDEERGDLVATMENNGRTVIVVMDRYLRVETPDANTTFGNSAPWYPMGAWCANMGFEQPRLTAYTTDGGSS